MVVIVINKKFLTLFLIALPIYTNAYSPQVCQKNIEAIEKQIQQAKKYKQETKVYNLEKTLERVKGACKVN